MSSSKDIQEEIATSLIIYSKPQKVNLPPIDASHEHLPTEIVSSGLLTPPTSPSRNESGSIPEGKKQSESIAHIQVSNLKSKLGLDVWQCGCLTQKNTPCTRDIREENKDRIDSQIESMVNLTQSSLELESKLDKLVMLVHCHQHDCGNPKDSRMDTWTMTFDYGDGVSVERQIKKAIGRVSTQCIGIVRNDECCKKKIGGRKVQNCSYLIDKILKPEVYLDGVCLTIFLTDLEMNMYCHLHKGCQPLQKVVQWKMSIIEIRNKARSKDVQAVESSTTPSNKSQSRAPNEQDTRNKSTENNGNLDVQNQELLTPKSSRLSSPEVARDLDVLLLETYDTTPFDIVARSDRLDDYTSSYELVQSEITRPLSQKDQKNGYIYLYEVEGNSGVVKLGYTGRTPEIRHEEWDFDCNRIPKVLYPISSRSAIRVPNARRVESLCHAELEHRRIRIYCKGCLKQHIEWFEISPAEAIEVITKWSKWMASGPYLAPRLRSVVKWSLKEEEEKKARNIDQFMKDISLIKSDRD
jgi:hypothetical protein